MNHLKSTIWLQLGAFLAVMAGGVALGEAPVPAAPTTDSARELPRDIVQALHQIGGSPREVGALRDGHAVAHSRPTTRHDEVAVAGAVRIEVPASYFEARYRDVRGFEPPQRLLGAGTFSVPARAADVEQLTLPAGDLADLESCRVGDCSVHLDRALLESLQTLDWDLEGTPVRAEALVREWAVHYVNAYRLRGNAALFPYGHRTPTRSHLEDATSLVEADALLRVAAGHVQSYLGGLDRVGAPFPAEEFVYWSLLKFTRKSIARLNHVVMADATLGDEARVIVSRTIFASHYLRDGLEVLLLMPDPSRGIVVSGQGANAPAPGAIYLLLSSRSHSDDLLGLRGALFRGLVRRRARGSLEKYLADLKRRLETSYQQTLQRGRAA